MEAVQYGLRLDVSKPGNQATVYVKRGDARSRRLVMRLYSGAEPYVPEAGATAVLRAVKPDETLVYSDCVLSGGSITRDLPARLMAVAGIVRCELTLYGADGGALFSPFFDVYVGETLYGDDEITSQSDFSALTEAMGRVNALEQGVTAAEAGRAESETGRQEAETARAEAETGRAALYTQVYEDYNSGLFKGDKGDIGPAGPQGPQGERGQTGPQGPKGDKGDTGAVGPQGPRGLTGPQGAKGDRGPQGIQGVQGPVGPQGPKGDTGEQGPQGPKGDKGDKGDVLYATFGIDAATGELYVSAPDGYAGPMFEINDGYLEVVV